MRLCVKQKGATPCAVSGSCIAQMPVKDTRTGRKRNSEAKDK